MREIKFRAWYKGEKDVPPAMWTHDVIGAINFLEREIDLLDDEGTELPFGFDQIELMQHTGLKDSKGREIFEGDILKTSKGVIGVVCYYPTQFFVQVSKEEYFSLANFKDDYEHFIENPQLKDSEVIGNIYENPELLK